MFGRTKEVIQQVADAITQPTIEQSREAVAQRQKDLVDAQAALDRAAEALMAAEDRGADAAKITELEAAIASARIKADRASRALQAAERRYEAAKERERTIDSERGLAQLVETITERERGADKVSEALVLLREGIEIMDACDDRLAALQAKGHMTKNLGIGYNYNKGATRSRLAVEFDDITIGPLSQRPEPFRQWVDVVRATALQS